MMRGSVFIVFSAAIALFLGVVHLLYTFHGSKLQPRDAQLTARMKAESPAITSQTTMWRVWTGVNATHSLCLILFATVYGYLAIRQSEVLFGSWFLLGLGLAMLLAFVVLSHLYFFRTPLIALMMATASYVIGMVVRSR